MDLSTKKIAFVFLFFVLTACDEPKEYGDVEVYIVSFTKWGDKKVSIEYQVENTGNKSIEGWKVWFNINFKRGPQIECYHGITCQLNPGDISTPKVTEVDVPVHNDDAINATLKHILIY